MEACSASQFKKDINIIIGRQIMILRKSKGLSGQLLAKKLGVSQQQISRYERGKCKIDIDSLIIILVDMDFSFDVFFRRVFNELRDNATYSYELSCAMFECELITDLITENKTNFNFW
ncbi:helix-turn-helix domain-containing protein [Providencia manganoxydans]|uniref:helix-turn-helix domain-containing protein n=1 Tax=Providencia manganoxydans TaxID=2923283 RepID=UPI0032DA97CE